MMTRGSFLILSAAMVVLRPEGRGCVAEHEDHRYRSHCSLEGDFTPLEGLELSAMEVRTCGAEGVWILGSTIQAHRFDVLAHVNVQTSCGIGGEADFAGAIGQYAVFVAPDRDGELFQRLKNSMVSGEPDDALGERDGADSFNRQLYLENGRILISWAPPHNRDGAQQLFHDGERSVVIRFEGFLGSGGWGGLSSFVQNSVAFEIRGGMVHPSYQNEVPPERRRHVLFGAAAPSRRRMMGPEP